MNFTGKRTPLLGKRERLAVSSSVVQFTEANFFLAPVVAGDNNSTPKRICSGAILQINNAGGIYYTIDGSTPSSTVGFDGSAGEVIVLDSYQAVRNFKAIRQAGDTSIEGLAMFGS